MKQKEIIDTEGETMLNELIIKVREGCSHAQTEIFYQIDPRVRAFCWGEVDSNKAFENEDKTSVLEDTMQEFWIKFFRYLPNFRGENSVGKKCHIITWSCRIVINLLIDVQRKRGRRIQTMTVNPGIEDDTYTGCYFIDRESPDMIAESNELIFCMMDGLEDEEIEMIMQYYLKNVSYQEIADKKGITVYRVNYILSTARKKIAEQKHRMLKN